MAAMMPRSSSSLALVLLCLYINISFSNSKVLNSGFSVEMIHRDSSRSPLYRHTETPFQRVANAMRRSINRANHFNKKSFVASTNTAESTVKASQGEYLMSYSVGTPPFEILGVVDTGSGITWMQCQRCEDCYEQTTPIFDPSKSKTYKTLPCSSNMCQSVISTPSCSSDKIGCKYTIKYGDGSHSQGDLSVETLTLGSTNGSSVQFPNTVIGCGHNNKGTFQGEGSGVVGLGGGPVSLISQLSSSIGGKFSYCLAPMFSQSNSSSKLNFGDAAVVSGLGAVSTPLVSKTGSEVFYYLTLEAFSVGDKRIEFVGGSSSSGSSNGEGNIIIDSGTTLTLLPQEDYSNLESAVADAIQANRVSDPSNFLSLCYQTTPSGQLDVPVITAHFKGADVELNPISTFVQVAEGVVCFAFHSSEVVSIFGNLAQLNLLVGYDLMEQTVSFKPTDCTQE
ncbi:Aspartic proteinase CDR1 [Glycine soja]|nr:aspartic proteinase CDR1 [Glycine max]|eukprot:XP_003541602.1 aspartic proteinase CDR1 [Glycine max]